MCLDLFTCLREGLSLTQHNLEKKTTWHMGPEDPSKSSSEFHFYISPIVSVNFVFHLYIVLCKVQTILWITQMYCMNCIVMNIVVNEYNAKMHCIVNECKVYCTEAQCCQCNVQINYIVNDLHWMHCIIVNAQMHCIVNERRQALVSLLVPTDILCSA